jgi:hypothetical protein
MKWLVTIEIWWFRATFQAFHINKVKYVMIMSICQQIARLFPRFKPHQKLHRKFNGVLYHSDRKR